MTLGFWTEGFEQNSHCRTGKQSTARTGASTGRDLSVPGGQRLSLADPAEGQWTNLHNKGVGGQDSGTLGSTVVLGSNL